MSDQNAGKKTLDEIKKTDWAALSLSLSLSVCVCVCKKVRCQMQLFNSPDCRLSM